MIQLIETSTAKVVYIKAVYTDKTQKQLFILSDIQTDYKTTNRRVNTTQLSNLC